MANVTPIDSTPSPPSTVTLDSVVADMKQWRANKSGAGERIPDVLWRKIFVLAAHYPIASIRPLLSISKSQYEAKYNELNPPVTAAAEVNFQEVKPQHAPHPAATERYHMPDLPATNTVVVELYRDDGKLMKIHTTTHRFKELLHAFYEGL